MAKWYESANFYHIYPIGLLGAPRVNEGGEVVHRFPVLTEKWLPYLEEEGFDAIYIGPLFESTKHGYDTIDYKKVDRRLGDNGDFKDFVNKAHELGIKIVVDGVFNHTGRDFFAFQDILKNRGSSPYKDWYKGVNFGANNAYNDGLSYDTWRGSGDLVNFNLKNPEVKNYLFDVIRFWVEEFDIDGIRLDCADVLDFDFMREMRGVTEGLKPDFWLMGEVIHGEYRRWIEDARLHSVTNYELWKGLYSGHNSHNYFEIAHTVRHLFDVQWGSARGCRLYSFADNHDVGRIASNLQNPGHLKPVYSCVYFLPGIPSVYYGSEFGIKAPKEHGDDALRPAIDLDEILENNPMPEITAWIKYLNYLRMAHQEACTYGEYRELLLMNRQYVFSRSTGNDAVIVAVNNDDSDASVTVQVPLQGCYYDYVDEIEYPASDGKITLNLPAGGAKIVVIK
jgi:glycosidase